MEEASIGTPRVNKQLLAHHKDQTARLVGKTVSFEDGILRVLAVDDEEIKVERTSIDEIPVGAAIEVIGKAIDDQTIREYNFTIIPETVPCNFSLLNQALLISHKAPDIYGWS